MHIRLTKKLAASLNGVDLSHIRVGQVAFVPDRAALMLLAEGWAELIAEVAGRGPADLLNETDFKPR